MFERYKGRRVVVLRFVVLVNYKVWVKVFGYSVEIVFEEEKLKIRFMM